MERVRIQIGPTTIKQYGRFHLKNHDVYRGDQAIPSFRYWIKLENGTESEEDVGLILMKDSTFPRFINHVLGWLHQQYLNMYALQQILENTLNSGEVEDEAREEDIQIQQYHLKEKQMQYERIVRALYEIAPDAQLDETLSVALRERGQEGA